MFVSLQFKLELKREDKEKLIKLMRKQSSAIRVAYNVLKESEKEKKRKKRKKKQKNPYAQIYQRLRQLFPELSTKYIDSAICKAISHRQTGGVWEQKTFLKSFAKTTLQGKQGKSLKNNGEN
jgi:predicted transposase